MPIIKVTTEIEKLEKQVVVLEAKVLQKEIELKKAKGRDKPSIGYFRARFKGG